MGKMNHSTYQLNAYTSDWGGGHGVGGVGRRPPRQAGAHRAPLFTFLGKGGAARDPLTTGEP